MTTTDRILRSYGVVPDADTGTTPITPEQKLLRALFASTVIECHQYITKGRIPNCCANDAPVQHLLNIHSLRLMDEGFMVAAGFRNANRIRSAISKAVKTPLA